MTNILISTLKHPYVFYIYTYTVGIPPACGLFKYGISDCTYISSYEYVRLEREDLLYKPWNVNVTLGGGKNDYKFGTLYVQSYGCRLLYTVVVVFHIEWFPRKL